MTDDPARVKEVFGAALERADPAARAAYLAAACGADAVLRRRFENLLRASGSPDSFLDHAGPVPPLAAALPTADQVPPGAGGDPSAITPPGEAVGAVVAGRYKLLE